MCGITGYISGREWDFKKMVSSLKHRGPDNSGFYHAELNKKKIFLGHTRLSILDLSDAGNQPMQTRNGMITIVYNGEIYNFNELKGKYLTGFKFRSGTDTEVILYLYELFGIDFISKLEGDFAIAIIDKPRAMLYLVRDRLGVKPLYYYLKDKNLIFGSEIKAIFSAGIKKQPDFDYLQKYFVFKYVPGNDTLFKNINRVPPGSYLEYNVKNSSVNLKKYWKLKKVKEYKNLNYHGAEKILKNMVSKSVNNRLISDVPVGNFLSGGLDSSIISSILKDREDIKHYCAKKSEKDLKREGTTSDYYYARKLSEELHLKTEFIDIGSGELTTDFIRSILYYSDDLIADGSLIPSFLITKEASESSKVILSGMGADELFLGYAGHQLTLMSKFLDSIPGFFSNFVSGKMKKIKQGRGKFLAYRRYLHRLGKYYEYPEYKYGFFNIVGDFENSLSVFSGDRQDTVDYFNKYFSKGSNVFDSIFRYEIENFLVKNLHYLDRMSMANSVESRVPYLDHRIVEFAYSIPRHFKLSNFGKPKKILKDAFGKDIPDYILRRRKAGFGMPLRSIFKDKSKTDELIDRDFLSDINGISLKNFDRIVDNHIDGFEDNSSIIYSMISFQEWFKMNFN